MLVNLSNLKHLDISMYQRIISTGELLEILKESSQLSSMKINPSDLALLFNDNQLRLYLNKMIKKLNIYKYAHSSFNNLDELKKFCRIFSNIEQLRCNINESKFILFLLYQLSKLSTIHDYLSSLNDRKYFSLLFKKHSCKLHFILRVKYLYTDAPELFIWVDKNIN
ncbi:unnamed protein product [Rotaria sp. Silwood2]|nr:unnamed protein product [Rotaria sp. Silwood2]